jgi:hypothetical protein
MPKKTKIDWFEEFKIIVNNIRGYKHKEEALEFLNKEIAVCLNKNKTERLRKQSIQIVPKDDLTMRLVLAVLSENWKSIDEIIERMKEDPRYEKDCGTRAKVIARLSKLEKDKAIIKKQFKESNEEDARIINYYRTRY